MVRLGWGPLHRILACPFQRRLPPSRLGARTGEVGCCGEHRRVLVPHGSLALLPPQMEAKMFRVYTVVGPNGGRRKDQKNLKRTSFAPLCLPSPEGRDLWLGRGTRNQV